MEHDILRENRLAATRVLLDIYNHKNTKMDEQEAELVVPKKRHNPLLVLGSEPIFKSRTQ